ncbi:MAG: RDD family protein [Alphaproteobacteria bacterium]|nr:MAG: RDD family protein [Alphaproteobacteria bacterium]
MHPTAPFAARQVDGLPDPERDAQFYDGVPMRRFIAWLFDLVFVGLITLGVLVAFTLPSLGLVFLASFLIWAAVDFIYRAATLARASATPGMRIMGIELRAGDGGRLDATTAILHTLLYYLCFGFVLVQIVNIALMLASAQGRSLPDLALGTAMINRPI